MSSLLLAVTWHACAKQTFCRGYVAVDDIGKEYQVNIDYNNVKFFLRIIRFIMSLIFILWSARATLSSNWEFRVNALTLTIKTYSRSIWRLWIMLRSLGLFKELMIHLFKQNVQNWLWIDLKQKISDQTFCII